MFYDSIQCVNAKVQEDKYVIQVLLPGVDKSDVELLFDKEILTIKTTKPTFFGKNFNYKSSLLKVDQNKYDVDAIKANLDKGILTIEIPMLKKAKKEIKKITIK